MAIAGLNGAPGYPPRPAPFRESNPGNQLYVGNVSNGAILILSLTLSILFQLPYQAGWQDLKDLFRAAGSIVRADINIGVDGRAKGSGTVIFETAKDAQSAISAS